MGRRKEKKKQKNFPFSHYVKHSWGILSVARTGTPTSDDTYDVTLIDDKRFLYYADCSILIDVSKWQEGVMVLVIKKNKTYKVQF